MGRESPPAVPAFRVLARPLWCADLRFAGGGVFTDNHVDAAASKLDVIWHCFARRRHDQPVLDSPGLTAAHGTLPRDGALLIRFGDCCIVSHGSTVVRRSDISRHSGSYKKFLGAKNFFVTPARDVAHPRQSQALRNVSTGDTKCVGSRWKSLYLWFGAHRLVAAYPRSVGRAIIGHLLVAYKVRGD